MESQLLRRRHDRVEAGGNQAASPIHALAPALLRLREQRVRQAHAQRLLDHVLRNLPDAEAPPSPLRRDECADQLIADLRVQFVDVVVAQLRQHRVGALQGVRLVDLDVHFIARGVRLHQHARRAVRRQDQNRELELAQLYPSGNDADITVHALLGSARLCGRAVCNRSLYA